MLLKCSSWPRFCTIRAYSLRFISPASMLPKNFLLFFCVLRLSASLPANIPLTWRELNAHEAGEGLPCMQESDLDMAACWVGLHDYGLD
jgi:hypothetical protein